MIRRFIAYWMNVLFPPRCVVCRKFLSAQETDICQDCLVTAPFYPYSAANPAPGKKRRMQFLDSLTAVWYYEEDIRHSILLFKFYKSVHLGKQFGRTLAVKLHWEGPQSIDYITWVPVSSLRKFVRGYDQAELLARAVGKELGMKPVRLLRKTRHRPPQSQLISSDARKANILGAYKTVRARNLEGKTILLIDDVFTTGATTNECAKTLRFSGAKEVHCAVIAAVKEHKK